jgi:unsaturated pyranuronate lyase
MVYHVVHFFRFEDMPFKKFGDKLLGRLVSGSQMTFLNCEFEKGAIVEEHFHENEQISYVVQGLLKGVVGKKEYILRKGDAILIPPNVPHFWEALEKTITLEMFSPINQVVINKYLIN